MLTLYQTNQIFKGAVVIKNLAAKEPSALGLDSYYKQYYLCLAAAAATIKWYYKQEMFIFCIIFLAIIDKNMILTMSWYLLTDFHFSAINLQWFSIISHNEKKLARELSDAFCLQFLRQFIFIY